VPAGLVTGTRVVLAAFVRFWLERMRLVRAVAG
jgi:hypothetical protein